MIRRRVVLSGLLLMLFGLGWLVGRSSAKGDLYANLDLFVEVLHKVQQNYVDPVNPSRLVDGALKGMLKDLDPYSQYLDERSYLNLQDATQNKFNGIGVEVSIRDNYPTVISPIEGSPAWEAGLHAGDVIVKIDGRSSAGITLEDAKGMLRGPAGTRVRLTVRREGDEDVHDVELTRREIVRKSAPYAFVMDGGIGYLRLADFSEKSGAEVRAALERLHAAGAKSLVFDVRRNPGGLLDQAVDVAEEFLPQGTLVVYTHGRARGQDNRFYASESKPELRWPMVALVDDGSASASEIVAGALQDRDRALLVGRTTFGKGSVQSVFPLRTHNSALKLTTALYYTPSGRSIHRAERDTLENDEDDSDDGEPTPGKKDAAPDSTSRKVYRTQGGRRVYAGGGITPDLPVMADSLPPLASRVEQHGLAFRFANRWANAHPNEKIGPSISAAMWSEFAAFLRSEKVTFTDADLNRERRPLENAVRRELARRAGGDSAAMRVALEIDPVFARAVQILSRVKAPQDVFAVAGLELPDRRDAILKSSTRRSHAAEPAPPRGRNPGRSRSRSTAP